MEGNLPHGRPRQGTVTHKLDVAEGRAFILANTTLAAPPHVPEIMLHLADEAHGLWQKTEEELDEIGLPPPFWAFAWAGGQGLARYILDHPETVAGKRVLDFAAGSGLGAVAACIAGARLVRAADTDPFSAVACQLNMVANDVAFEIVADDLVGAQQSCDVLLAGDVFYDRAFAARLEEWFAALAQAGTDVLVGDPGRAYLPKERLLPLATYCVPVTRVLEDAEVKRTTVWRFG
ncbi:methyltransferase [Chelativorans sp. Marseille-P2723]|uniref:class I SAM-dependent methyltransferase n=1 Tax=Chelativorans sp. Marseille-P2723 TaxID=2709133 RepID=UPI00156DB533|nr:methyltransferase [Chelativorans sp. Marseille-P2723]